jgi:peroxiredoxin
LPSLALPDWLSNHRQSKHTSRSVTPLLSDFKGKKNVVLAIYVLAFTGG